MLNTGTILRNVNTGETVEVCMPRTDGYVCMNVNRNVVVPYHSTAWQVVNKA